MEKMTTEFDRYVILYYQELIDKFVSVCKATFGQKLTGVYLYGSMAMGCFNPHKSDIDLLVVINEEITNEQKMEFMEQIISLNKYAPAKGLEVSIVNKKYCNPVVYPTPFELHFSPMHLKWFIEKPNHYVENMKGEDKDLVAHFAIVRQFGKELYGEPILQVFGDVKKEDYVDSIQGDLADAKQDILENPIYVVLNMCRALAYIRNDRILSKEEGGQWGMVHLEEQYRPLILSALQCYKTDQNMQADDEQLLVFASAMQSQMKSISEESDL